jgi:ribose/xylose/arabinose/galactoside ABC-type transport system permease subunit
MVNVDLLVLVLVVAGLGSGVIMSLALAALARRQSLSYFLVTLALATLLTRTLFGVLTVNDVLPGPQHHVLEHGLDVLTVLFLFAAVVAARSNEYGGIDGD